MMNGHASPDAEALAHRPGLDDVLRRQRAALARLDHAFTNAGDLQRWKLEVIHAAVGRINEGLNTILGAGDVGSISDHLLTSTDPAGDEWRLELQASLPLAFGWSLRDLSQITQEINATNGPAGIARGGLDFKTTPTTFK